MDRIGPSQCPVCYGSECRGGGNKGCIQRDPRPSHIGAILDRYGGVRTVVTHKSEFRHHVRHDELLVVVGRPLVHTPIAWGDIPMVVAVAKHWLDEWVKTNRPNEPWAVEAIAMYKLRELEDPNSKRTLDLNAIVET